ncbi:MAG: SOS response-associated peptidase [Methanomicrobiales archaeon]|nr:SOS response-associated peptidase [Methanomicrobiales archaeon]
MCGRFTIAIAAGFFDRFQVAKESSPLLESHFNITPAQEIPVIISTEGGNHVVVLMTWGLVPAWASDRHTGHHPINARAENLTEKPMFSGLVEDRRCLIPANGFFEWKKTGTTKIPSYIHRKDDALFAFAGLYDVWKREQPPLCSCTIVTTTPNLVVAPLHDRMPAILRRDDESVWLEKKRLDRVTLSRILSPYPAEELESYRISRLVNDTSIDSVEVIARVGDKPLFTGEQT